MKVHVLTAVSRPQNLPRLARSLAKGANGHEIVWHWRFDLNRTDVGGQAAKNAMLDEIQDGWVYVLDDDTLMHPRLLSKLTDDPEVRAIIVSQQRKHEQSLAATSDNLRVGHIDIGQALLRREMIGSERIPLLHFGDGLFLETLLKGKPGVVFCEEELSYYNSLER